MDHEFIGIDADVDGSLWDSIDGAAICDDE